MTGFLPRAVAVLISVIILAGFEWGSRCWLEAKGTAFHKSLRLLGMDPDLGWRQNKYLDTVFLGARVITDKDGFRVSENTSTSRPLRRILILGPSSTFGWGVSFDETYAAVLRERLEARSPGSSWQVVNAGQIGFSSWQGARLLTEILKKDSRWDWIVFAYGLNDVDRHRFFYESDKPDSLALGHGPAGWRLEAFNRINRAGLTQLIASAAYRARTAVGCRWISPGGPSQERVSEIEFNKNNAELLSLARGAGAKVVFLTTVTTYQNPATAPKSLLLAREALQDGVALFRTGRFNDARVKFKASLAHDDGQSEAHFWLSMIESAERHCAEARGCFELGRANERLRIARLTRSYNLALIKFARHEKVPFLDLEGITPGANPDDFVDPVHFSPGGHGKIAEGILRLIASPRRT